MKIATPIITNFDKEDIAPWTGNRLIELHMATLVINALHGLD